MKVEGDIFEYNSMKRKQVFVSDILYLKAVINYSIMFLTENRKIVLCRGLAYLEKVLPDEFDRVHQSLLVRKGIYEVDDFDNVTVEHETIGIVSRRKKLLLK